MHAPLIGVSLAAAVIVSDAFMHCAHAQIFGTVQADGTVVLTNMPSGARGTGLRVIVEARPAPVQQPADKVRSGGGAAIDMSRYGDIIAEAGRTWNVQPELLRAVIAVESKFNPRAVSKKGARGLMQLMPETGRRFSAGDLFDPRANVLAGARYLRLLLDLFSGDIELALAAYNAGEAAVIRAGYRIPAFAETQSYVPAVMAHYRRFAAAM
ncbi:lytic transglycosylase domain-containing protein [Ralstonia insidiosa]|jgi:soluble lytic murein transglycosylase-like protein|uniref:lytic transglycosylase domain-containing protein n=2 Tax=Pseudomonadota TaxID=1224 RepID=UPI000664A1F4|nr:lytic transglycosylase domain-containing protein [Ralstonia insidiosa]KMW45581.1 lytic transglycosylase [Ralstonia sp. MD27]MBX3772415.1 lytic transglycosylase domain-containing protein [Ralstonia pickettii]NOZ17706.1 lytic transglycosylase domain-containing protein [Betaproteobacteria bacterium]MBA9857071.1 lytic transglycosylase domain-containing protein [Ralstonia insidiosa]MBA9870172.1 lytic transglycosylase domain-containing protein [Ralstonia insidiosa]